MTSEEKSADRKPLDILKGSLDINADVTGVVFSSKGNFIAASSGAGSTHIFARRQQKERRVEEEKNNNNNNLVEEKEEEGDKVWYEKVILPFPNKENASQKAKLNHGKQPRVYRTSWSCDDMFVASAREHNLCINRVDSLLASVSDHNDNQKSAVEEESMISSDSLEEGLAFESCELKGSIYNCTFHPSIPGLFAATLGQSVVFGLVELNASMNDAIPLQKRQEKKDEQQEDGEDDDEKEEKDQKEQEQQQQHTFRMSEVMDKLEGKIFKQTTHGLAFSYDSLIVSSSDKKIVVFKNSSLSSTSQPTTSKNFPRDSQFVEVWRIEGIFTDRVCNVAVCPVTNLFVAVSWDKKAAVFDLKAQKMLGDGPLVESDIFVMCCAIRRRTVVTGDYSGNVRVYKIENTKEEGETTIQLKEKFQLGRAMTVWMVQFDSRGRNLIVGGSKASCSIYRAPTEDVWLSRKWCLLMYETEQEKEQEQEGESEGEKKEEEDIITKPRFCKGKIHEAMSIYNIMVMTCLFL